jgi:hypothetical protein
VKNFTGQRAHFATLNNTQVLEYMGISPVERPVVGGPLTRAPPEYDRDTGGEIVVVKAGGVGHPVVVAGEGWDRAVA